MGLGSAIFGGGGFSADKPEYRNMDEWTGALQRIASQYQENPEALKQYFGGTSDGKTVLKRLGFGSVDDLLKYAQGASTGQISSKDYANLGTKYGSDLDSILQGYQNQSGDLTDFGSDFALDDISNVPDEVYQQMQEGQEESSARGFKGALQALGQQYGSRGFRAGTSGFEQASGSGLGRGYLEQLNNISRDVGMQKANSKLDVAKFMSNQKLARQTQREQYLTQLQQYAKNFGTQNLQNQAALAQQRLAGMGNVYQAQNEQYLQPYQLGQDYYNRTANTSGGGKKGIFGSVLKAGTSIAGAALSPATGGASNIIAGGINSSY